MSSKNRSRCEFGGGRHRIAGMVIDGLLVCHDWVRICFDMMRGKLTGGDFATEAANICKHLKGFFEVSVLQMWLLLAELALNGVQ